MAPDIQDGDLTLSMTLDRQALRIEQGQVNLLGVCLDFIGSADLATVFPDGFLHPPRDMDHLAYELSFDQTGGDFTRLAPWIPGFSGRFSSHGRLQGRGFDLDTLWAGYELGVLLRRSSRWRRDRPPGPGCPPVRQHGKPDPACG
jgi:translocation and assembly module TamB